jgi:hypothetical protein
MKAERRCPPHIAQHTLEQGQVRSARIMHVQADLLNGVGDVRPGDGQILQAASEIAILRRIGDRRTGISR